MTDAEGGAGAAAPTDAQETNLNGFPVRRVDSLLELLRAVRRETADWPARWFRGVYGDFGLLPGALRDAPGPRDEMNAFLQFKNGAPSLFDRMAFFDDISTLFLAQHHGVRTRLLDWSQSLGVAIYFALDHFEQVTERQEAGAARDVFIWALDPGFLNRLTREDWSGASPQDRRDHLARLRAQTQNDGWDAVTGSDRRPRAYAELATTPPKDWPTTDPRTFPMDLPLAAFPPALDKRIMLQRGAFTLHGRSAAPLESQIGAIVGAGDPTPLTCWRLPNRQIAEIEEDFRLIGPTSTLIYGDPQGLARDILRQTAQRARPARR